MPVCELSITRGSSYGQATVRAWQALRVAVPDVADLRRQSGPPLPGQEPLPAAFLKHADEQTVVALTAVRCAAHEGGLSGFARWGVVAAPRLLGRAAMTFSLARFQTEGAWGVSPHVIPHRSLHALSGTISQALRAHGPNFGVGGGPGNEAEALLAACALLAGSAREAPLEGIWLVFARVEPELPPMENGTPATTSFVDALALALVPPDDPEPGLRLRLITETPALGPPCTFDKLRDLLASCARGAHLSHPLGNGLRLDLTPIGPHGLLASIPFPEPVRRSRRSA